jgi:hypothetical protein
LRGKREKIMNRLIALTLGLILSTTASDQAVAADYSKLKNFEVVLLSILLAQQHPQAPTPHNPDTGSVHGIGMNLSTVWKTASPTSWTDQSYSQMVNSIYFDGNDETHLKPKLGNNVDTIPLIYAENIFFPHSIFITD